MPGSGMFNGYHFEWGNGNDPEIQLAKFLMADRKRFKKTAKVVYRTRCCNEVVGFVYPVVYHHPSVPEVSQVLFRLSRWENLEYAEKI